MDDDDYGADDDLLAAMAATAVPAPQRIQQPIPQRLDRPPPPPSRPSAGKVVQPTPQALPQKPGAGAGSAILVSPRQKGNPVIAAIKKVGWEYSDVPADYVLGATTCALFLSLKYHRLHPEYIYTRIKGLGAKYHLRLLLTLVDIPNHEDPLRELAKTALVNNATLLLCWSAAEAAHYLELYKSHEASSFAAIRGAQSSSYADRLTDFVTAPRGVNKSDAVALVASFGSLRRAVAAGPEELGAMGGWGGVKVKRWCRAVEEPFRVQGGARRGVAPGAGGKGEGAVPLERVPLREMSSMGGSGAGATPTGGGGGEGGGRAASGGSEGQFRFADDDLEDDEEELMAAALAESRREAEQRAEQGRATDTAGAVGTSAEAGEGQEGLSGGVADALARLRQGG